MTTLDWSSYATGRPRPCRLCGHPATVRDAQGRACHKVCAERAIDSRRRRLTAVPIRTEGTAA